MHRETAPVYSDTGKLIGQRLCTKMYSLNGIDHFVYNEAEIYGEIFPIRMKVDPFQFIEKHKISNEVDFKITGDFEKFCLEIYNYNDYYTNVVYNSLNWLEDPRLKRSVHFQKIWLHISHFQPLMSVLFAELPKEFKVEPILNSKIVNIDFNVKPNLVYLINISTVDYHGVNFNAILDRIEYGNGEGSKNVDFNHYFCS